MEVFQRRWRVTQDSSRRADSSPLIVSTTRRTRVLSDSAGRWSGLKTPSLKVAATTWILAGGAHHTSFSQALTPEYLQDYAEMADMEFLLIDGNTSISEFKKELRWNDAAYRLGRL